MAQRYEKSGKEGFVLLVLSDFDPEGEDIGHSLARSLRDDFNVDEIKPVKVALTANQVEALDLPPSMKAKAGSSRRRKFVEKHGEDVFELEAVPPERLQEMLRDAIESAMHMGAFQREIEAEKTDAANIQARRRSIAKLMEPEGGPTTQF